MTQSRNAPRKRRRALLEPGAWEFPGSLIGAGPSRCATLQVATGEVLDATRSATPRGGSK